MFSHQTRESLGQLQETIQSVQPVAGDRSEEIKKAVREEVMMEARPPLEFLPSSNCCISHQLTLQADEEGTSWDWASKLWTLHVFFPFVPQAFRQVMSQVKKLHEEAFKGGGKGEASSSWKGKEIRKEEVKDEEVQKAGWVFVSACAGQAPWR